ncbi:MAG: EFR1 family ferrodoxin [Chloroflexota bacterium]
MSTYSPSTRTGGTPGLGTRRLSKLIEARGGRLAAGLGVHMPYNYLTPTAVLRGFHRSFTLREIPLETQQSLLARVESRLDDIAAFVSAKERGVFEESSDLLTRLAYRLNLPESLGKSTWLKVGGIYERVDLPFMESRQLMDRAFNVDERCTGCGICANVCPVGNIHMADGRPAWQQHCEQCFACLHWCPKEALQFGSKTSGKRRYHHPDVTLADMVRQRRQTDIDTATAAAT